MPRPQPQRNGRSAPATYRSTRAAAPRCPGRGRWRRPEPRPPRSSWPARKAKASRTSPISWTSTPRLFPSSTTSTTSPRAGVEVQTLAERDAEAGEARFRDAGYLQRDASDGTDRAVGVDGPRHRRVGKQRALVAKQRKQPARGQRAGARPVDAPLEVEGDAIAAEFFIEQRGRHERRHPAGGAPHVADRAGARLEDADLDRARGIRLDPDVHGVGAAAAFSATLVVVGGVQPDRLLLGLCDSRDGQSKAKCKSRGDVAQRRSPGMVRRTRDCARQAPDIKRSLKGDFRYCAKTAPCDMPKPVCHRVSNVFVRYGGRRIGSGDKKKPSGRHRLGQPGGSG